jgi:hypothetical protein
VTRRSTKVQYVKLNATSRRWRVFSVETGFFHRLSPLASRIQLSSGKQTRPASAERVHVAHDNQSKPTVNVLSRRSLPQCRFVAEKKPGRSRPRVIDVPLLHGVSASTLLKRKHCNSPSSASKRNEARVVEKKQINNTFDAV